MRNFYERLGNVFAWLGFVCLTIGVIPFVAYSLAPDVVLESRHGNLAARAASTRFFQIGCEQLEQVGTVSGLPQAGATTFDQNKCHLGGAWVATFWWELDSPENYGWIYSGLETAKQTKLEGPNFLHVTSGVPQPLRSAVNKVLDALSHFAADKVELILPLTILWPVLLLVNYLFWGGFRVFPWRSLPEKI